MRKLKNTCCFSIVVLLLLILSTKGYGLQRAKGHDLGQIRKGSLLTSGYVVGANLLTGNVSILSSFLNPSPQEELFIWVRIAEEAKYFAEGYRRPPAGIHQDGNKLDICRVRRANGLHPGKIYKNQCLIPWGGKENIFNQYQILMVKKASIQWPNIQTVSANQIQNEGVVGGRNNKETLYICRMPLKDGRHPGKFLISTNLCYVAWGGKEITATNGFEVLLRNGN